MHQYGVLHDGQSQSCSSHFSAAPFIYAVEPLKQSGKMLRRYSYAVVRKRKVPRAVFLLGGKRYVLSLSGVGNGVVGEVAEDTVKQASVSANQDVWWYVARHRHVSLFERKL